MIEAFKNKLLAKAVEYGFSDAEMFYQSSVTRSVNIYNGEVEKLQNSDVGGFSFRGLYNDKMGYFYSESVDMEQIDFILKNAMENAQLIESEEKELIYDGSNSKYAQLETYDEKISLLTVKELTDLARCMEKTAFTADSRVKKVIPCTISVSESYVSIGNTKGVSVSNKSNCVVAYAAVIVEENNDIKECGEFDFFTKAEEINVEKIAVTAAENAVKMLGASSVKTGNYNVIFKNEAMADLLDSYISNFYGENVRKGFSLLKGKLGEKIANEQVTIIDNPHLCGGGNTVPFDSEGVPTRVNKLVERGVLKMFIHNLKSAAADGVEPTGNGFKGSFKGTVGISATNLYIENGTEQNLLEKMQNGILVTELSGLHAGTNSISGDFSLLASGFMVENGKISNAVEQITVSGNFYQLLNKITALGNDLKFNSGVVGSPSVLCENIMIAGEQ